MRKDLQRKWKSKEKQIIVFTIRYFHLKCAQNSSNGDFSIWYVGTPVIL